ncbi:MAG: GNAT family N-acetyltransferase [Tissierellia bacterium]|nr:GNAT family N-acetyltransferase [Tissierellia bacterium]
MERYETGIKDFTIRRTTIDDTPLIYRFIRELADYEGLLHEVKSTEEILRKSIFEEKACKVVIAELAGEPIGFSLYFHNFSTFEGRPGLYLEDLYIDPKYRGKGYGKKLLQFLAHEAVRLDCKRFEWWCLNTNTPSFEFYKSIGAEPMDEWTVFRIDGTTLIDMADKF